MLELDNNFVIVKDPIVKDPKDTIVKNPTVDLTDLLNKFGTLIATTTIPSYEYTERMYKRQRED